MGSVWMRAELAPAVVQPLGTEHLTKFQTEKSSIIPVVALIKYKTKTEKKKLGIILNRVL